MQELVTEREPLRVAWYSTAGAFDADTTGRASDDPATSSTNAWPAPSSGSATLWVALSDDRGGVDFASIVIEVAR